MHSYQLRAMDSDVLLISALPDGRRRLRRAARWLQAFEARFSRFRPQSELSRLNACAGRPFTASPALFRLVSYALQLAQRSGGLFDPAVLRPLEAAGYDRSFGLIQRGSGRTLFSSLGPRSIRLDPRTRTIELAPGTGIDLGGIGKGWACDRLAAILGPSCLADCGGDVRVRGKPSDDDAWRIGVADPFNSGRDICVLRLRDRGVATSSTLRRSWDGGGRRLHHLIDPRSGQPSDSDAVQVTALAETAALADFHAKVALLQGAASGLAYLEREPGVEGIVVDVQGRTTGTSGVAALSA